MVNVAVNVLAELGKATWPTTRAVGYETALEGVRQSIGFYSQSIATEEQSDEPDTETIELRRAEQLAWAKRAQDLTPLDTSATESIGRDADKLLAESEDDEGSDDDAQGG